MGAGVEGWRGRWSRGRGRSHPLSHTVAVHSLSRAHSFHPLASLAPPPRFLNNHECTPTPRARPRQSWLVAEHNRRGFPQAWLSET